MKGFMHLLRELKLVDCLQRDSMRLRRVGGMFEYEYNYWIFDYGLLISGVRNMLIPTAEDIIGTHSS
jgi:hypothetical protein